MSKSLYHLERDLGIRRDPDQLIELGEDRAQRGRRQERRCAATDVAAAGGRAAALRSIRRNEATSSPRMPSVWGFSLAIPTGQRWSRLLHGFEPRQPFAGFRSDGAATFSSGSSGRRDLVEHAADVPVAQPDGHGRRCAALVINRFMARFMARSRTRPPAWRCARARGGHTAQTAHAAGRERPAWNVGGCGVGAV